ncbi:MAG: SDR family oxidoreductase [Fimbriiglobus sp.]
MRSLVFGARGLIGSHIISALRERDVPTLASSYQTSVPGDVGVDIRDADGVRELIRDYEPEAIYVACPVLELTGLRALVTAAKEVGAVVVGFTADEVFASGTQTETSAPNPTTPLGQAHAAWEQLLQDSLPGHHILVRSSMVFGGTASGFVSTILNSLQAGDDVRAHARRHAQPTYAPDLAEAVLQLVHVGYRGTIHLTGPDRHTEFTLARLICHVYGFDCDQVSAYLSDDDARPLDLRLDRKQMRQLIGAGAIRPVGEALRAMRDGATIRRAETIAA